MPYGWNLNALAEIEWKSHLTSRRCLMLFIDSKFIFSQPFLKRNTKKCINDLMKTIFRKTNLSKEQRYAKFRHIYNQIMNTKIWCFNAPTYIFCVLF